MSSNLLDQQTETQVVAMLARGDKQQQIIDYLLTDRDIVISPSTLTKVKQRNSEALAYMKNVMVEKSLTQAANIREKSLQLLEHKVDQALTIDEEMKRLLEAFENEEIEAREYYAALEVLAKRGFTVSEATSVSKEMFNQSQIEAGKPTSINSDPASAKEKLQSLLLGIKHGDDVKLVQALFS